MNATPDAEFVPRNVLVTGGAGFIGSNFIHHLLATAPTIRIVNLDLLTYAGSLDNLETLPDPTRHTFVHGDICDQPLVEHLLNDHAIDTIVHFAADSHVDRSIAAPAPFIKTNVVGTFHLLEAAREYWKGNDGEFPDDCRFHHVSTDEVYGSLTATDPAFTETTRYQPNSPYSASKAGADHLVHAYVQTYGLPATINNCSNNYGPFQHREKFIPTIIRACLEQRPIPVYGDGSNIRDWLYVTDHCRGIDLVLRRGRIGECYNVGGSNERANLDLVRALCTLMDEIHPRDRPHAELISFVDDRPGHDWRYAIDITKISTELGWKPEESSDTGFRRTVEWYCARWTQ